MNSEAVLRELQGMRALARSLVHGDAEADDLLQDAALAVLERPPHARDRDDLRRGDGDARDGGPRDVAPGMRAGVDADREPDPGGPRAWLAVVLRNRRRMDVRAAARRTARERAVRELVELDEHAAHPDAALDRARAFERLAAALVALEEPFRTTIIKRYLDGMTSAAIARALGVPAGTVRWRLKIGLERLRAALDRSEPRWQLAFAPIAGVSLVKTKTTVILVLVALLLGIAAIVFVVRPGKSASEQPRAMAPAASAPRAVRPSVAAPGAAAEITPEPPPGQGRVVLDHANGPGSVAGRVINWSTGDGVEGADITFTSDQGATTVRSGRGGAFELAPGAPGRFTLATIAAPRFLPYAPELKHSTVDVEVIAGKQVRGITVFLFPAVDYHGRVVDAKGAPVAGAKVRLLGTPANEQAIDNLETEWTADADGKFLFHAADDAVLEAARGNQRGWATLTGDVAITKHLTIAIGSAPARDKTITGRVTDAQRRGLANVLVRAEPEEPPGARHTRSTSFTTTNSDGSFVLANLDDGAYMLITQDDTHPPAYREAVGGARDVSLVTPAGRSIAGTVTSTGGDPIGAYTLLVLRRLGSERHVVAARSIVDATGRFEIPVADGEYDVQASANGWAPSPFVVARAGDHELAIKVSEGATLRGQVLAADGSGPIKYARIMREARSGGSSAQPANAGTVTRADGTFELAGIPPGPVSIRVVAGGYHPKIEAGMTASDGGQLGPLAISLVKLKDGEQPRLELVGIGAKLVAVEDGLRVDQVFPDSGAAAAGIAEGETIVAVDGIPVVQLGLDGAIAKIRGVEGTTVAITLSRAGKPVQLVVTRKKLRA